MDLSLFGIVAIEQVIHGIFEFDSKALPGKRFEVRVIVPDEHGQEAEEEQNEGSRHTDELLDGDSDGFTEFTANGELCFLEEERGDDGDGDHPDGYPLKGRQQNADGQSTHQGEPVFIEQVNEAERGDSEAPVHESVGEEGTKASQPVINLYIAEEDFPGESEDDILVIFPGKQVRDEGNKQVEGQEQAEHPKQFGNTLIVKARGKLSAFFGHKMPQSTLFYAFSSNFFTNIHVKAGKGFGFGVDTWQELTHLE